MGEKAGEPRPGEVGICVSGGGLRAASFGLGALQALQARRGLLRGESAARYLSAVSGGSYIAGAYTLFNRSGEIDAPGGGKGTALGTGGDAPFAPGSKEAEHLRRHCRYMVEEGGWKTSAALVGLVVLNLLAVTLIVGLAGFYLGVGAAMVGGWLPDAMAAPDGSPCLQWPLAVAAAVSISYIVHSVGAERVFRSKWAVGFFLFAVGVAIVGLSALVSRLESVPLTSSPAWIGEHWLAILAGLGALLVANAVVFLLGLRFRSSASLARLRRVGTSLFTLRLVQLIGLLAVSWLAVAAFRDEHDGGTLTWVSFLFLVIPIAFGISGYVDRFSPHLIYRDLLVRCFSVIRTGDTVSRPDDPRGVLLSAMDPPGPGRVDSFPELLICAAANISDVGATPAGSNSLSVVFTPKKMLIPAVKDASIPVTDLERFRWPTRVGPGWGPAVNLASVVAMTGAAVSPAMGKRTRNDLRALFAIFNVRLGVWLPNPLDPGLEIPEAPNRKKFVVGLPGLIREMFGFHPERSGSIYVTDGGHYDNLGLVELLRRECSEIWCVDASGDRPGRATALSEAILTAAGELGVRVDIDLDKFARVKGTSAISPEVRATHVSGDIHYANGREGKITVVKLGIKADTPAALKEYRRGDRPFPYHSTMNQIFRADRFDAYRALGWASTNGALDAVGARAA